MKKVRIKFGDRVYVHVPYKGGLVVWVVNWISSYSYTWLLHSCPVHYRLSKVKGAHKEFLEGRGLCDRIIKVAAASHNWSHMENFVKVKDNRGKK